MLLTHGLTLLEFPLKNLPGSALGIASITPKENAASLMAVEAILLCLWQH
jgi:hypothetical protein